MTKVDRAVCIHGHFYQPPRAAHTLTRRRATGPSPEARR
jgi:hypothetical protein